MIVGFLQLRQRYPKMALTLKCVKPKQDILLGNIWKKLHQTMKIRKYNHRPKNSKITNEIFCYILPNCVSDLPRLRNAFYQGIKRK